MEFQAYRRRVSNAHHFQVAPPYLENEEGYDESLQALRVEMATIITLFLSDILVDSLLD